ncbi:MAG: DUF167 domain-containing protein [Bryobacteraceae bacterium]
MDIDVKVIPRASRSEVSGTMSDGSLKVKVAAVPEKGKANAEVCEVLARHFDVPVSQVEIVAGATSTRKRVRISGR